MGCRDCLKSITVEPMALLYCLCQGISLLIVQEMYIEKTCSVNLNYSMEICGNLTQGNYSDIQAEVHKHVSILQGINGMLQAWPGIVIAMFAGSWSDIFGRKPLIIASCFGYVINNLVYIINAHFWFELKAEYLLFECLQDFTGGNVVFSLACVSYISDVTTKETRTRRIAYLSGTMVIGYMLGVGLGSGLKSILGYYAAYTIAIGCTVGAMLYALIFLKDSRTMRPAEAIKEAEVIAREIPDGPERDKKKDGCCNNSFADLFDIGNVKRAFKTTFKRRPFNVRPYLLILISVLVIMDVQHKGPQPIGLLFFRKQFKLEVAEIGIYMAIVSLVMPLSLFVVVPVFTGKLNIRDSTLGAFMCLLAVCTNSVIAFGTDAWILYVSGILGALAMPVSTLVKSSVTKCVSPFEVGAVLSIVEILSAIAPMPAMPFFGFVYRATVDTFPGAYLLIVASLALLNSALLFSVRWGLSKSDALRELDETNQRLKEDLLPKGERPQRPENTDVTKEYKRIVSKESDRQ